MASGRRTFLLKSSPTAAHGTHVDVGGGRRAAMGVCAALGLVALARYALGHGAEPSQDERRAAEDVFRRAESVSRALAEGRMSPTAWQESVEEVFRGASADELLRALDVESLIAAAPEAIRGAVILPLSPRLPGLGPVRYLTKLFVLRAGRGNPPHAHDHMTSMHYVLRGRFRVRHYDRVRDEPGAIVLRPTIDRELGPGEATSVSDRRDNVHWHFAESDGILLEVICAELSGLPTERHLVDPVRAEALGEGLLRAPRVSSVGEALERFG